MAYLNFTRLCALLIGMSLLMSTKVHGDTLTASEAAQLYSNETTYSIFRKGKIIGKHRLLISSNNNRIDVSVDSKITVRVLKVPVFRFRYQSSELWEGNKLLEVNSTTTTNKDVEQASLKNKDNQSILIYDNEQTLTNIIEYATNHWNISAVEQDRLFNTVKGVESKVDVQFVGNEPLKIKNKLLNTKHYAYSGDITAQTWYDQNNRWVKLAFLGSDGNQIIYLIDTP